MFHWIGLFGAIGAITIEFNLEDKQFASILKVMVITSNKTIIVNFSLQQLRRHDTKTMLSLFTVFIIFKPNSHTESV